MSVIRLLLTAPVLAMLLAGCGGGEMPWESSDDQSVSRDRSTQVEGRAAKGILQFVQVDAYVLEGDQRRHLARTRTNDDGDFTLSLGRVDGPVLLEVTPRGDGSTRMICDAVDGCGDAAFGESGPVGEKLQLTSVVMPSELGHGPVAVTPLTHLASGWARSMPGALRAGNLELARHRVAALMQVDKGFAFQRVPDITGDNPGATDTAAAKHALMAAAFAERSADDKRPIQATVDGYGKALGEHAGQLQNHGDFSLRALYTSAHEIAEERDILPETRYTLDLLIAGLPKGVSSIATAASYDETDFDRALTALDELDYYLNEAGIDESGEFLSDQANQVNWLYEPETGGLIKTTLRSAQGVVATALIAGVLDGTIYEPDTLDLSCCWGGDISAVYDFDSQELIIEGVVDAQKVDLVFSIDPVTGHEQKLEYSVEGSIANQVATARFDGTLSIDLFDTDLYSVMTTVENMMLGGSATGDDFEREVREMVEELHMRNALTGAVSVVKTSNEDFGFRLRDVAVWSEWNLPALDGPGVPLAMQIDQGELISPQGDRIADNPKTSAPALSAQVGLDSTMTADFIVEAFGLPEIKVRADGIVENSGSLLRKWSDELAAYLEGEKSSIDMLGILPKMDFSSLDFGGEASVVIEDMERGRRTFAFSLENDRLEMSLPNSSETAMRLQMSSLRSAYLYSGDSLVGTVTFNWQELGATVYLVNGESRGYYLGPITDILPPKVAQALKTYLG